LTGARAATTVLAEMRFCGDDHYGSHAVTAFETEVSPGDHNVAVFWKIFDNDPDAELLAEITNWTLLVLVRD
jgi:hypothetical protein